MEEINIAQIESRSTTEFLKCILTSEEKRIISEQVAQAIEAITKNTEDAKAVASQFKAEITKAEAVMQQGASKIRNGYEMRQIPCRLTKNFDIGLITCYRSDNDDIVYQRPMTPEERQPALMQTMATRKST